MTKGDQRNRQGPGQNRSSRGLTNGLVDRETGRGLRANCESYRRSGAHEPFIETDKRTTIGRRRALAGSELTLTRQSNAPTGLCKTADGFALE